MTVWFSLNHDPNGQLVVAGSVQKAVLGLHHQACLVIEHAG